MREPSTSSTRPSGCCLWLGPALAASAMQRPPASAARAVRRPGRPDRVSGELRLLPVAAEDDRDALVGLATVVELRARDHVVEPVAVHVAGRAHRRAEKGFGLVALGPHRAL